VKNSGTAALTLTSETLTGTNATSFVKSGDDVWCLTGSRGELHGLGRVQAGIGGARKLRAFRWPTMPRDHRRPCGPERYRSRRDTHRYGFADNAHLRIHRGGFDNSGSAGHHQEHQRIGSDADIRRPSPGQTPPLSSSRRPRAQHRCGVGKLHGFRGVQAYCRRFPDGLRFQWPTTQPALRSWSALKGHSYRCFQRYADSNFHRLPDDDCRGDERWRWW